MFMKDDSSRLLFANNTMRELFDASAWVGRRADEFMSPAIADSVLADDRAVLERGPTLIEESLVDKQGRTRFWRTWKFPLEREDGQRLLAGISYDITEQRQAENAYRTLVDSSLQGLALVRNGVVIFANAQAAVITGYSREELLSFTPEGVFGLVFHADHALVLDRIQRRQCGEELPPMFHIRIVRKDGAIRKLILSTAAIEYEGAQVVQAAFLDITDFREAHPQPP
jgi:PAS domain S-box-containing protein